MTATEHGVPPGGPAGGAPPPRWGVPDLIVAFLTAQFASALGFALYASVQGVPLAELDREVLTIGEIALLQAPLWLGLLGVPLLATRLRGGGPRRDLGLWTTVRDAPRGLAIGVACQLVLVPIVTLPVFLLTDADQADLEEPARELTDKAQGAGVLLLVLVVVVMAPLAEEVFFRGMLQRTLARSMPIWPAMILASVLFGVSHFQPLQLPALAAFGLVLSLLVHRSGRLGPAIWAHVGFNATTVVALLLAR
ncbi:MAG TPA: type II CAAX endopeptidase family protein [Acidimicrobiales bacterium]|nr:type II CAAX endopeptidase family protein [Acidimicrobiales bacterium]